MTESSGVDWVHRNGREAGQYFLIESFGGGVGLFDYDLDGRLDLLATGGGRIAPSSESTTISGLPSALFRNEGAWRFADCTGPSGLSEPADYSLGCSVVDFDGDGFPDLFVCCYGRSRLYRNQGDGTFAPALGQADLPAHGFCTACAWGDVDGDGLPDLLLGRYVEWDPASDVHCHSNLRRRDLCGPAQYEPTTALLLRNRGDGAFEDWSERSGIQPGVKGLGLMAGDFNEDGQLDFYLANDEMPNHLYWGRGGGRLEEQAWHAGVAADELGQAEGSMGVAAGDVDGDERLDLWVVNFENEDNSLYLGLGEETFEHATVRTGLAGVSRMNVGWGTSLTDFDGDGWLDVLVLNGNAVYFSDRSPWEQPPQLFRNLAGRRFENISERGGTYFRAPHAARGNAVGDLDDDGAPDIAAGHINEPLRLLRSRRAPEKFISLRLCAVAGERSAVGARVRLCGFGGASRTRWITHGSGYASHSEQRILSAAPGDATDGVVCVRWPGRAEEKFTVPVTGPTVTLVEGRGVPLSQEHSP